MSKTTSNIASWIIGVGIVLLFVSCVSTTMSDASGCAQVDQFGGCIEAVQP